MAEVFYSTKAALHIGIVDIICGLISIGIGAFSTRNDDHSVFTEFKPEGLPVWAGILFVITGGLGVLSFKNPRKCMIIFFMMFSVFCVGGSVIIFWCLMPQMQSGNETISWTLSYGSFLTLTAIAFIVSMKAIFICFRFTISHGCNCSKRNPPRQRPPAVIELGTTLDLSIQHEPSSQRRTSRPIPSHRGASGSCRSQRQHNPYRPSDRRRRSRDRYQDRERPTLRITQNDQSRERQNVRDEQARTPLVQMQRPTPPPPPLPPAYQTIKFPYLPSYSEVEALPPPPPYTEK
ncbi:uncharacterized protein LOC116298161 [Actinia tenebrosa]|uniref:Uncharacterized protein LOC116298161 n=1 Tax=Actinia tenebrosa TaxID=6105 RepID=A0A6P8I1H1_ACTTE|nr:uncharacterized protein LOC116298161 [Actinia tenebrosa]